MSSPTPNIVMAGFSPTNRALIYVSLMFTPAQALSGLGSNLPFNMGFLAYNIYQQYLWYIATKTHNLHALSIIPVYLNFIYPVSYLGGVPSGNMFVGIISAIGTAGLIILNTITAWISVRTNLPEGDGIYQFFFFGWRRLTHGWRIFFLVWEVSDTILVANVVLVAIYSAIALPQAFKKEQTEDRKFKLYRDTAVLWGSVLMLAIFAWPLILWMELIVKRNNIVSETDMIAVYLFIAQAALTIIPIFTDRVGGAYREGRVKHLLARGREPKVESHA